MLQLQVWHAQNTPRAYIDWIMMLLTLSCTTRLERPGLTSGPLYHYLRLFTVKCLVWMGCGVEFSSPQRTRFLHILRLCLMFLELMSCGACNVSFGDVNWGFLNMQAMHCGFIIFVKNEQSGNSSFFLSVYLVSRYQHLWCVNSCACTVKFLMLVGGTGLPAL